MKRFIGFLTLVGFMIASNMQFIHANEMKEKPMYAGHIMQRTDDSLFCQTSTTKNKNECYKDLIGDKSISSNQTIPEFKKIFVSALPVIPQFDTHTFDIETNNRSHAPPEMIFQRTSYSNLSGIVKSLN